MVFSDSRNTDSATMDSGPRTDRVESIAELGSALSQSVNSWCACPPFGFFFKWLGGVPVDRRDRNNLVAAVVDVLKERDELILIIAPEGTRSRTKRWKTGFYYVALGAGVPILLGYLDFARKRGGILHVFHPTGDIEADMAAIRLHYDGIEGKHPERMSEITLGARGAPANGAVQHP